MMRSLPVILTIWTAPILLFLPRGVLGQTTDIYGSWQGVLSVPGQSLRVVFNFSEKDGGGVTGTMDSPDQGAKDIPLGDVVVEGRSVKASVPQVVGTFEGTASLSGAEIVGFWSQGGRNWPLTLAPISGEKQEGAKSGASDNARQIDPGPQEVVDFGVDVTGTWTGTLTAGAVELRVVYHLLDSSNGGLTGTMDSPDQNAHGIPLGPVTGSGRHIRIEVPSVGGVYDGEIGAGGKHIDGTWTQSGRGFPLKLERVGDEGSLLRERPQEPRKPLPYRSEDVVFDNTADGIKLAGTLTLPSDGKAHAAAVLISGSGPQNRDEEVFNHRPFLVIADHLTRKGMAVLRYDDRGVGASEGDYGVGTMESFARDAQAAFRYLSEQAGVTPRSVGLIGHSEGGLTALIASTGPGAIQPSFIILLATPAVSGKDLLYAQSRGLAQAMGASDEQIHLARQEQEAIYSILSSDDSDTDVERTLREYLVGESRLTGVERGEAMLEPQIRHLMSPWFRHMLRFDPRPAYAQLLCPVLAVVGSKDLQVPPETSLPHIEQAVRSNGNADVTVVEIPGLNHLFQRAETGLPMEYGRITETINVEVLDTISTWIVQHSAG